MKVSSEYSIKEIEKFVEEAKNGDRKAFYNLYQCTWEAVYFRLLKKTCSKSEAQTLLQEVYSQIFANLGKLNNDTAFVAWVTKITDTTYHLYLRDKRKLSVENYQATPIDLEETDVDFIPSEALGRKELRTVVIKSIEELPKLQRDAIFMFYYQNLTIKQISDSTGTSENTVYKRLHDAKKNLRAKLSSYVEADKPNNNTRWLLVVPWIFENEIKNSLKGSLWKSISRNLPVRKVAGIAVDALVKTTAGLTIAGMAAAAFQLMIPYYNNSPEAEPYPYTESISTEYPRAKPYRMYFWKENCFR